MRRYAGDDTLPPGRFATVCASGDGDDGGALAREMRFYTDAGAATAHLEIYDPAVPAARQVLEEKGLGAADGRRLCLLVIPFEQDAIRPVPIGFWTGVDVEVRGVDIDGVLDLRRQDAANWLARTISSLEFEVAEGERLRCFPFRPDVPSFPELLPAITDQAKGGGNFHIIVGLFLRQAGVAGLVFPSVRGDFFAECREGSVTRSAGWTFVDYRDAPPPGLSAFFELRQDWPTSLVIEGGDDGGRRPAAFAADVRFIVTRDYGSGNGGIATAGLERRHEAVFRVNAVAALLRQRLQADGAAEIETLLEFFAGLSAEEAERGANMALYAGLGMEAAQRDLAAQLEGPLGQTRAAPALRSCLGTPPYRRVTGAEFLTRWFVATASDP